MKNTKVTFVLGGATLLMVVALAGSTGFNGKWDDDNKFINRQYGRRGDIHKVALAIIICSLIAAVFFLLSGAAVMLSPVSRRIHIGLYITSIVIFFGAAAAEILGLVWTQYGDVRLYSVYNYYDKDDEFKKYVDTYTKMYTEQYSAFVQYAMKTFSPNMTVEFCTKTSDILPLLDQEKYKTQIAQIKLAMGAQLWTLEFCKAETQKEENKEFANHVIVVMMSMMGVDANILLDPEEAMTMNDAVPPGVNEILHLLAATKLAPVNVTVPTDIDWSNYMQPYYILQNGKYVFRTIAPVAMNWTGMILDSTLISGDPCVYLFDNTYEWGSIGRWSAEEFKKAWCWNYRKQNLDEEKWLNEKKRSEEDILKRRAKKVREEQGSDSLTAFYEVNSILLGLQVAAFVVLFIALIVHAATIKRLDFAYKPMANDNEV